MRLQSRPTPCTASSPSSSRCWNRPSSSGAANCGRAARWNGRSDEDASRNDPTRTGASAASAWESHLKLDLPALGALDVHIRLDAQQRFSIRLAPAAAATVPVLQGGQSGLVERLAAAGCTIQAFEVARDADA